MSTCVQCGNRFDEGQRFCRFCGARLDTAAAPAAGVASGASEADLALFIGKNAEKYLSKFQGFHRGGRDSFGVTWHWPAFFLSF